MPWKNDHEEKLKIKRVIELMGPMLPPGDSFRLIPDIAYDGKVWSLRLATPYSYPDGEAMYVYIEVNDGKKDLVRLYDDEVLHEWLLYHDLLPSFLRIRKDLEKRCLEPIKARFTLNPLQPYQVSMVRHINDAFAAVEPMCKAINDMIMIVQDEKFGKTPSTGVIDKIMNLVKLPEVGQLATA